MFDWIAEKLGFASMAPWLKPTFAFALSIASSFLGWLASDTPWATLVLLLSVVFALWALAESFRGTVSGFFAGFVGFYILMGLSGALSGLHRTHYGCVAIDGKTADNCIEAAISKATSR